MSVPRALRRLVAAEQENLNVVNGLRSNQAIIDIGTDNETAIRVLNER